jgi:hypothetical protein
VATFGRGYVPCSKLPSGEIYARARTCAFAAVAFGALVLVWHTPAFCQQSSEPSSQSSSPKPDQIEAVPEDAPVKSPPSPSKPPELFKIPNFASCPLAALRHAVPELAGLKPSTDQTALPALLKHVGATILEIVRRTPNLISRETVNTKYGASHTRQHFSYLVLPHAHPGGVVAFDEFRVDPATGEKFATEDIQRAQGSRTLPSGTAFVDLRGLDNQLPTLRPGGPPLAQGFANMWVYFEPLNLPESSFRYLGEQKMSGHRTLVLAFSQKPESVLSPAVFRFQNKTLPIFIQGVAWVDASSFKIVRLRTDLLFRLAAADVRQLTADIEFAPISIAELNLPLWMPRQVFVTWNLSGHVGGEKHHYSDYRLFRTRSKVVLNP